MIAVLVISLGVVCFALGYAFGWSKPKAPSVKEDHLLGVIARLEHRITRQRLSLRRRDLPITNKVALEVRRTMSHRYPTSHTVWITRGEHEFRVDWTGTKEASLLYARKLGLILGHAKVSIEKVDKEVA